jgi:hypothetical protein
MDRDSIKKREKQSAKSHIKTELSILPNAIDWANDSYRSAESLIQSRLYNYLVAASILFLSWATVYASKESCTRIAVLITLSAIGMVLSILWWLLSMRQRVFLTVTMDIILYLESLLDNNDFRIATSLSKLRSGEPVELRSKKGSAKLGFWETKVSSRSLVIYSPALFGFAFLILLGISIYIAL